MPTLLNTSVFEDVGFGTSLTKTLGFTPADNTSNVLPILVGDTGVTVTAVTGYTFGGSRIFGNYNFEVWLRNSISGSPTTAPITLSAGAFALVAAFNFAASVAFAQITTVNANNSATPSVGITAAANSAVIAVMDSAFQRVWSSPSPAGFTLLDDVSSIFHGCAYEDDVGAGGALTIGATMNGSNAWGALAFELTDVAAPSGQPAGKKTPARPTNIGRLFSGGMFRESFKQLNSGLLMPAWV